MSSEARPWFSVSRPGSSVLRCAACRQEFDLGGSVADHHPAVCPVCGVECIFVDWKDRIVQVVTASAPARLPELIRWLQNNFDELDYVQLLCALEELADAVDSSREPQVR